MGTNTPSCADLLSQVQLCRAKLCLSSLINSQLGMNKNVFEEKPSQIKKWLSLIQIGLELGFYKFWHGFEALPNGFSVFACLRFMIPCPCGSGSFSLKEVKIPSRFYVFTIKESRRLTVKTIIKCWHEKLTSICQTDSLCTQIHVVLYLCVIQKNKCIWKREKLVTNSSLRDSTRLSPRVLCGSCYATDNITMAWQLSYNSLALTISITG